MTLQGFAPSDVGIMGSYVRLKYMKKIHGLAGTKFYCHFGNILKRCNKSDFKDYDLYGGRGIKCEWKNFNEFLLDMYESFLLAEKKLGKKNVSIDRIDNNKNYCKENCRWVTAKDQARNRRSNHLVEYNGQVKILIEWAEYFRINYHTLFTRLNRGWTFRDAVKIPIYGK